MCAFINLLPIYGSFIFCKGKSAIQLHILLIVLEVLAFSISTKSLA